MLGCEWNDCPIFVDHDKAYYLDQEKHRIAFKGDVCRYYLHHNREHVHPSQPSDLMKHQNPGIKK